MPKHIAKWNPARDAWEDTRGGTSLFCGHSDVYSGTFPASGMTRSGVAYELQTWEHRTGDTGYSSSPNDEDDDDALLRTPCAAQAGGGPLHPDVAKARGQTLRLTGQILAHTGHLLPTPSANVGTNGGSQDPAKRRAGGHQPSIQDVAEHKLIPTPSAGLGEHRRDNGQDPAKRRAQGRQVSTADVACHETEPGYWGIYTPAIRRWEAALGRSAPNATEPTGRGGKHKLSPAFVEWMMGLPEGWVTDAVVSHNDQLKALGNGVVPQQCTAALRDMLATNATEAAA